MSSPIHILGLSAYYHDSAAAILRDGVIVAAAQEERFSRKKQDERFPTHAVAYCLREAGISLTDVDHIVFYDKPLVKFERLLETYVGFAPSGLRSWITAVPVWIKEKLFLKRELRKALCEVGDCATDALPPLLFTEHHEAHAASAFFASPYEDAAVLCLDGVGEWATTSVWTGSGNTLKAEWQMDFPHSLGLLYSAFTYYTGFKVNSGEYKVMGLAPYGEPTYVDAIYEHLVDLKDDGTFRLNMAYFNYATGLTMTNAAFDAAFGGPPRQAESKLTQREMDLARSVQVVTEEIVLRLARTIRQETGARNLCLAGGVALNCVANGRLLRELDCDGLWIQPAAGDAGGALGAALAAWYTYLGKPRVCDGRDFMRGSYLGPAYSDTETAAQLDALGAVYERLDDDALFPRLAQILDDGQVIGWMSGRMEFGPRALGGRSIIGDPRNQQMQSTMNLKIKYRESFRPFAPSVLRERVSDYFEMDGDSPYMLLVAPVKEDIRIPMTAEQEQLFGIDKLRLSRSQLPSITHVDYSARIQTVHADTNPRYYRLIKAFEAKSGCGVIVNTSFNVRGEPIVCSPEDSYRCFMRTEMDYLVIDNYLLAKPAQPPWEKTDNWQDEFELD